jgi:ABC-type amino acid transport substrate-binding protein
MILSPPFWIPLFAFSAQASDPAPTESPSLEVAVEDAAGPWSMSDGTGYTNDLVRESFRAVGVAVTFQVVPYARCKYLVLEGKSPACFSMSPEAGHEDRVSLSAQPLFEMNVDYYQNKNHPLAAKSVATLPRGTVIGVVLGYEYPMDVTTAKHNGVTFEAARDEVSNLKKLKAGRIDAAILNHNDLKKASDMIERADAAKEVELAFHDGKLKGFIAFSKQNPDGPRAEKLFDEGFRKITANGTAAKIRRRWLAKKSYPTE